MKNYLFAPFKNDDDKIDEFNAVVNALERALNNSASYGLRVFIGRLESYYDVIISKLESDKSKLKAENIILGTYERDIKELQAENKALDEQVNDLMIDKDRLVKQVSSNSSSSSSTHTQTISKEVQDYINHHPEHKEVRLFILPIEEFDEDECCNKWLTWDEGIEV